jgi:hypothetical protein
MQAFSIDAVCANFSQHLKDSTAPGFRALLTMLQADAEITDPRWAAYMLATARWECAQKWEPIEEFGHGKNHPYGQPVTVVINGTPYTNIYYGRGYVQLTWEGNYATMSHALGLGDLLITNPEHLLERPIAYKVMSFGMRHGSFTGASLHRFINENNCDYVNARKIINGLDQADIIAGYAREFEQLLSDNAQ